MENKVIAFLIVVVVSVCSCTSFNKYSKFNKIEACKGEVNEAYVCITNDSLKIKYVSFGGFDFANNSKEYNKLKVFKKLKFKNILLYGHSSVINTEYYILIDNKEKKPGFVYKDTIINKIPISIAVNDSSNKINKKFLLQGVQQSQK